MKSKKGFTLIELLVVIAILGILVALVVPNILKMHNESKIKIAIIEGKIIIQTAEKEYQTSMFNGENNGRIVFTYLNGEESSNIEGKKLINGSKPESGNVVITKSGGVAYAVYINGVCLRKEYNSDEITTTDESEEECIFDVTPKIFLNGEESICVNQNTSYTELGATAYSNEGDDITSQIVSSITKDGTLVGSIDTATIGKYIIKYEIEEEGIKAAITRTVNIINPIISFAYTGAEQTYTIACSGTYKLEVWGAQGGTATQYALGGKGGYSTGKLALIKGTQLYIYAGGQGTFYDYILGGGVGGFNGGGRTTNQNASSGGGATDIRISGNTLYHRLIVAGGGAGSFQNNNYNYQYDGGYGGGSTGGRGLSINYYGGGGTQTSGGTPGTGCCNVAQAGAFGIGGAGGYNSGTNDNAAGGGGGGWYGGGGGESQYGAGGGGSGYIWTSSTASNAPVGYLVSTTYYLSNAITIAGNSSMPNITTGNEIGHSGNGYVRITRQ